MRRLLPFVFPVIAFLIVVGLLYRWYNLRTSQPGQISDIASKVAVQPLSNADAIRLNTKTADLKTSDLVSADSSKSAVPVQGAIRYEMTNGQVHFSVSSVLPPLASGQVYQVWLRSGTTISKAFVLTDNKGGWMGSGSIATTALPVEVLVSKQTNQSETLGQLILKGELSN